MGRCLMWLEKLCYCVYDLPRTVRKIIPPLTKQVHKGFRFRNDGFLILIKNALFDVFVFLLAVVLFLVLWCVLWL